MAAAALPVAVLGDREGPAAAGAVVVLVHGVGLGAEVMAVLAARVGRDGPVAVVDRPGYGRLADQPAASLDEQVHRLATTLRRLGRTRPAPVLVGVSGGATLALALLTVAPELVSGALVHEPLLGPLAPTLHAAVAARAERLAERPGSAAVCEFLAELIGAPTWHALPYAVRDAVAERADLVRSEVATFARFAPTATDLAPLAGGVVRLLTTVGERSGPARHEAAAVLARHTDACATTLPRCGHLAPVDAPDQLLVPIRHLRHAEVPCPP